MNSRFGRGLWPPSKTVLKFLIGGGVFIGLGWLIHYTSTFRFTMNFHEVDAGKLYRSAQLTPAELEDVIREKGIKTVINLRGLNDLSPWYIEQKAIVEKMGAVQLDLSTSAAAVNHPDRINRLNEFFATAERPILVHCRQGADRTGEAVAMYAVDYMGQSPAAAAEEHLSFAYWHVDLFKPAKRIFASRYQGREWARTQYTPCAPEFRAYFHEENVCESASR
jgi:protein tyrosine/serine phosphatase